MTQELKPCPFCGSEEIGIGSFGASNGTFLHYVKCEECDGASMNHQFEAEAIAAWNRRAPVIADTAGARNNAKFALEKLDKAREILGDKWFGALDDAHSYLEIAISKLADTAGAKPDIAPLPSADYRAGYKQGKADGLALASPAIDAACSHRLVDARNEHVESGYLCVDCGAVFAAADHAIDAAGASSDDVHVTDAMMEVAMLAFFDQRHAGFIASLKAAIEAAIKQAKESGK